MSVKHINEGRGEFKEVRDRVLPTKLDKECLESARKGGTGIGMNDMDMNESQSGQGHYADISGDFPSGHYTDGNDKYPGNRKITNDAD